MMRVLGTALLALTLVTASSLSAQVPPRVTGLRLAPSAGGETELAQGSQRAEVEAGGGELGRRGRVLRRGRLLFDRDFTLREALEARSGVTRAEQHGASLVARRTEHGDKLLEARLGDPLKQRQRLKVLNDRHGTTLLLDYSSPRMPPGQST